MSLPVLQLSHPCGSAGRCDPKPCPWCGVVGGHEPLCLGSVEIAHFDGKTYEAPLDYERLGRQLLAVLSVVKDGRWRTLSEVAAETGEPEASISARLRDLRKEKFGGHTVERRRRGEEKRGLFEYRLGSAA